MDRLIYSALAGISETNHPRFQLNNEIANVLTAGFKRSFVNASQTVKISGDGFDTRFSPTSVSRDQISLHSGPLMFTGNNSDIAMNGHTVLGVSNSKGELAFTRRGDLRLRNARFKSDEKPIDPGCACYCCQHFSRAYVHHLQRVDEMLGAQLATIHNLHFYLDIMRQMREAIEAARFEDWRRDFLAVRLEGV